MDRTSSGARAGREHRMKVVTTAPQAYDYSYTTEVEDTDGECAEGERLVTIKSPALKAAQAFASRVQSQRDRYASGLHTSRIVEF